MCSITKDPAEEHRWFTGCYDDCCVWDQRNMKSPLARRKTAGGVWRIRPHYSDKNVLALACMYGGAEVVRLSKDNAEEVELLQRYTGHSSITYGNPTGTRCSPHARNVLLLRPFAAVVETILVTYIYRKEKKQKTPCL